MSVYCSTSHPFVVTGDAQQIGELLCGPQQHNEHCKAWRWKEYVQHDKERMAAVDAEMHKMHAERRERLSSQQRADVELAAWQAERRRRA